MAFSVSVDPRLQRAVIAIRKSGRIYSSRESWRQRREGKAESCMLSTGIRSNEDRASERYTKLMCSTQV